VDRPDVCPILIAARPLHTAVYHNVTFHVSEQVPTMSQHSCSLYRRMLYARALFSDTWRTASDVELAGRLSVISTDKSVYC